MNDLINDWVSFCEGRADFDKSHFLTLFHEIEDRSDIDTIISASSMYQVRNNLNQVLFGEKNYLADKQIIKLAINDLKCLEKIAIQIDSNYSKIAQENVEICETWKKFEEHLYNYGRGCLYDEIVSPYILMECIPDNPIWFAAYEAFYGINNDYRIANCIISPILLKPIDFSAYLELGSAVCDYITNGDSVVIGRR